MPVVWQPLFYSVLLSLGMFLGYKLHQASGVRAFKESTHASLDHLVKLIRKNYVDSISEDQLYQNGIEGIIKHLDPHTVYIPANELGRVNEELEGTFYGIGVEFYFLNDTLTISAVIPKGPSEGKNIVPGDKIIRIDTSIIAGKKLIEERIVKMIRGQKDTRVKLTLLRIDGSKPEVTIDRNYVPLSSVPAFFTLEKNTGYIKINMFSETTYDEFHQALQTLCDQQIKSLIIDVRDNPGGYMDAVVKIADELVAGQHAIVSTKNKTQADSLMTEFDGLFEKGKVAILVDENSASASEILAGALQDLDRGLVVGRRTYGKGLVQEQFELPDQSAIRITTARYYLPSGRCIQRSYAEGKDRYRHEIIERFSDGKLANEDSSHQNHKVYLTRDKRKVYSDEGISPDFFVPLDTIYQAKLDPFYTQHIAEQFAQRYYFYHPNEFKTWKTAEQFAGNFQASDSMRQALKQLLVDHKIDPAILAQTPLRTEIEQALKVQFARLLFGNNGRYRLLYEQDEFIRKAIQVLDQEHSASRR